ncbi:MAG: TatD family hydrolase [Chloroflexi bacterium]|nr:TatD family hydrolase [Chloroflexota bacterium]
MLIDTHCHLDLEPLDSQVDEVVERAREAGVAAMIVVGIEPFSWESVLNIAHPRPGLYAALGLHPNYTAGADDATWDTLAQLLTGDKVVAIGETGLDFYRDKSPKETQIEAFKRHIRLARELALPLIIHSREADDTALEILESEAHGTRGVMHCFSGSYEMALRCIGLGYYISLAGPLTYKNAGARRDIAGRLPLDRLVLETDSPFLSPEPYRGRANEPARVRLVAEALAAARGISVEEVIQATGKNARALFGIR